MWLDAGKMSYLNFPALSAYIPAESARHYFTLHLVEAILDSKHVGQDAHSHLVVTFAASIPQATPQMHGRR